MLRCTCPSFPRYLTCWQKGRWLQNASRSSRARSLEEFRRHDIHDEEMERWTYGDIRSVLITSICNISNRGSQIPEPLLLVTSTCPLKFKSPRGWANLSRLNFWKLAPNHRTSWVCAERQGEILMYIYIYIYIQWYHMMCSLVYHSLWHSI